jgi:hypothetical protein
VVVGEAVVAVHDRHVRVEATRLLPFVQRRLDTAAGQGEGAHEEMRGRVLGVVPESGAQDTDRLRALWKHVRRRHARRGLEIGVAGSPEALPAIAAVVRDLRMLRDRRRSRLGDDPRARGVRALQHSKRVVPGPDTHVVGGDLEHALGVARQMAP